MPPYPLRDDEQLRTYLILHNSKFLVGFVINDPNTGPIMHQQIFDDETEARTELAAIEADLYDRPIEKVLSTA